MYELSFVKRNVNELAVYPGLHRHRVECCDGAESLEVHGHIPATDVCNSYRHTALPHRALFLCHYLFTRIFKHIQPVTAISYECEHQQPDPPVAAALASPVVVQFRELGLPGPRRTNRGLLRVNQMRL